MSSKAISVCKGKGSMNHNNRKFITKNVDEERMKDNIYYIQEPLQEAYDKCFGKAIEEYNATQKRADRRIDGPTGYIDKIRNSKNGEKLYYELVVQVGNMRDTNVRSEDGQIAKEILDQYMKDFQQRNPNIYVFNAVLHMDEQTPHLHIDYIPLAKNYKKGLSIRNSLEKALNQQGMKAKGCSGKFNNATLVWQEHEKDVLEVIMKEHGIDRADDKGLKRDHMSVEEYKLMNDKLNAEIESIEIKEIDKKPYFMDKSKVIVSADQLKQLEKKANLREVQQETYAELINQAKSIQENAGIKLEQANIKELEAEGIFNEAEIAKAEIENIIKEKDKEISYHASNSARYSSEAIHFEKMYKQEKDSHNHTIEKYNDVVKKYNNLVLLNKKEKEEHKIQLNNLTEKYEARIKSLQDKLKEVYTSIRTIVQATISLIRPDSPYKANLSEKQYDLVRGIEEYSKYWAKEDGFEDIAKELQQEKVSPALEKFMPELQKQRERELALERQRKKVKSKSHGMEH